MVEVEKPVEVIKEVIKEVEVIKEIHIKDDADKIDDTNITIDTDGNYKIFDQLQSPDDPENTEDTLTLEFMNRTKVS